MPMSNGKRVHIVGVGALGSHVALLSRNWKAELVYCDFDKIEAKNTQAQFHTVMGQGRNKAQALQLAMQGLFRITAQSLTAKLTSSNQKQLLGAADLIIDCTDNAEARELIQTFAKADGIACLHGCLSADGTLARAVWTEHFTADSGGAGQATCEDGENLPFHGFAGAFIAEVAQHYLRTGEKRSWQLTATSLVRIA